MNYRVQKPGWLKKLYGNCTWNIATGEPDVYLTFDDGPHPTETAFVLDTLKAFDAKATFFCIGENVARYPALYERIVTEGHSTGNHTHTHLDGWKTWSRRYYRDVEAACAKVKSPLFRPPFGHITPWQVRRLAASPYGLRTVMWSINSGDWDEDTAPERCYDNVARLLGPGAIVVFHDNDLAVRNLRYALPRLLAAFTEKGFRFKRIEPELCS